MYVGVFWVSVSADHTYALDGNFVNFTKGSGEGAILERYQTLTATAEVIGPQLGLSVESLDYLEPSRTQRVGHPSDNNFVDEYQYVPVKVELFEGDSAVPTQTWTTPSGWLQDQSDALVRTQATGAGADERTTWKLQVTNTSHTVVTCQADMFGVYARLPLQTRDISLRVLNHAFKVVIEALTFNASVHGNQAVISFGEELASYTRNLHGVSFTPITKELPEYIDAEGELLTLDVKLTSGQALLDAMNARWKAVDDELQAALGPAAATSLLTQLVKEKIDKNNTWRKGWTDSVRPDFLTLHTQALVTDIHASADILWFNVDVADIEHLTIDVYLAFEPTVVSGRTLILSPAEFTGGVAAAAADLGVLPEVGPYIESFAPTIDSVSVHLGRYLAEALLRMARGPGCSSGLARTGRTLGSGAAPTRTLRRVGRSKAPSRGSAGFAADPRPSTPRPARVGTKVAQSAWIRISARSHRSSSSARIRPRRTRSNGSTRSKRSSSS